MRILVKKSHRIFASLILSFKFALAIKMVAALEIMYAKIAQLVERDLAKVEVAGSNPVFRSVMSQCSDGEIGRHAGLKIQWTVMSVRVQVPL